MYKGLTKLAHEMAHSCKNAIPLLQIDLQDHIWKSRSHQQQVAIQSYQLGEQAVYRRSILWRFTVAQCSRDQPAAARGGGCGNRNWASVYRRSILKNVAIWIERRKTAAQCSKLEFSILWRVRDHSNIPDIRTKLMPWLLGTRFLSNHGPISMKFGNGSQQWHSKVVPNHIFLPGCYGRLSSQPWKINSGTTVDSYHHLICQISSKMVHGC